MSIRLPETLADQLKAKATEEGISMTEIINRFARQGLRLAETEERTVGGFIPNGWSNTAMQMQESSNGYGAAPLVYQAQLEDDVTADAEGAPDNKRDLLTGFEAFIEILEESMGYLTEEKNRESIVETIGELAKLKTRIKLDPCFRQ